MSRSPRPTACIEGVVYIWPTKENYVKFIWLCREALQNINSPTATLPVDQLIRLAKGTKAEGQQQTDRIELTTKNTTDFGTMLLAFLGVESLIK